MMGNQNVLAEESSYPSLVTLCFSSVLVYILITACYRLYFHPLASFPGPFWARLTVIPSWWHTRTGDRHIWMHSLQEKYGPEFRYRPDSVVLNTPSAFKKIFGPKGNVKKSDYYRVWPRNVHSINTWSSTTIDVHARKRRVLNYAFSEAALRDAEVFLHSNLDRWLELIGQQATKDGEWTTPINMCDWINWLVFDILGDLCFGKNFKMKEPESDLRHIPEVMATYLEIIHSIAFSPFADIWLWLKPRGLDWLLSVATPPAVQRWQDFVNQCLANRSRDEQELEKNPKPESEVRRDFFHWLFKAVDPETGERGYDLNELYAECELLTIAGSDTTSVVMSAAFFYLAKQPAIQAKLAEEIRSTFSSYDDIRSGSKITSCKYMTAFLQEAMRMTPPLAAEPSRQVLPGGTSVDDHYFPAGVHVSTGMYCLSYNANVYPKPFKFRPERWIVDESGKEGSSAESVALAETGFCAFSFGTRGCVGKNLAWLEMRLVLAKTLWMYEVQGVPGNNLGGGDPKAQPGRQVEDQYQLYDMFVANRKGPVVQMRKRQC